MGEKKEPGNLINNDKQIDGRSGGIYTKMVSERTENADKPKKEQLQLDGLGNGIETEQ